jgi:hypothetical protein
MKLADLVRSPRRGLSLLAATLLLGFVVYQAPHTVHHLFESTADEQTECAFASSAERTQTTAGAVLAFGPPHEIPLGVMPRDLPALPSLALAPSRARAPPARTT